MTTMIFEITEKVVVSEVHIPTVKTYRIHLRIERPVIGS